ncbi:AraC family transcriptional regulator [Sorangium cellulosum]|uniref:AraC family transcriptional regulator n=1 Tax=Sorangium cellulosum TaxID=56 RepID=A0A2L0FAM5_SORCE|nr:AraC family transcriptional regulator [Sorangium cellulosum]AUX48571.1 AraC family transcriptional regulator [Sorangium cellulosum]
MHLTELPSRADRLAPLPPHVTRIAVSRRIWNGVCVDVTEFWGHGEVCNHLCFENEVRLSGLLEEAGGRCEPRLRANKRCSVEYTPRHMHFAPAGMDVFGYSTNLRYLKDVTLVFDVRTLEERLGERMSTEAALTPRLRFADDRLWTLLKLLSDAADDHDPSAELYGDGLTAAIIARLLAPAQDAPPRRGGLSPWQLRRVEEHLEARLPRPVSLSELAALTGLSQAHFAREFKASTGRAPYRWQLERRIDRAQALLLDPTKSLDDVADATGFVDAAHFGRTFRNVVGATPGAWRRERIG